MIWLLLFIPQLFAGTIKDIGAPIDRSALIRHIKPEDHVAWSQFSAFIDRHQRLYASEQETLERFQVFKQNLEIVRSYQESEEGTAVYGVTKFFDLTPEEFKKIYVPYIYEKPVYPNKMANLEAEGVDLNQKLPESFDWRDHGAVTDVKDQRRCGSCWAFSTTGNIEGQWFLAKKKLVSLSEQQIVDCDVVDKRCDGGRPDFAYDEIVRMGGLETEADYPYVGRERNCHADKSKFAVYINDSVVLPHDEEQMKAWLVKKGPISIAINGEAQQFYAYGILHPPRKDCWPFIWSHAVLIVGYGVEKNTPYWIIKNSYGENWGEDGYMRLFRGENVCGVEELPTSAIVK